MRIEKTNLHYVSIPWEPVDAKRRPLEKELAAILKAVPEMKKITPEEASSTTRRATRVTTTSQTCETHCEEELPAVKAVTVPVMEELQDDKRRVTKLQYRGNWQDLGPVIEGAYPCCFLTTRTC